MKHGTSLMVVGFLIVSSIGALALPSYDTHATMYDDNIAMLIQQLNASLYLDYLGDIVAFGPRVTGGESCTYTAEYIYNEFIQMGLTTRYDNWSHNNIMGSNVEATIPGVNMSSDDIYIICAHYDTVHDGSGADDDGSGVAAVLSAAKLMSTFSFNHTIRFVAFSGEEQGLLGSRHYANAAAENNESIVAVLNVDMIGYALTSNDESRIRVYENTRSRWVTEFTVNISTTYSDAIRLEVIPSGSSSGSDHYHFWRNNYSAVFYAEYTFNPYWHTNKDIIGNMNINYAIRCTRLIIATLADLAELVILEPPEKPATPSGPTLGNPNIAYTYTTSTTDPQNDRLYYQFDWSDGNLSEWYGPYTSAEQCEASHIWLQKGDYSIKVKAKDIYGLESTWSDPLPVSMPKPFENPLHQLIEKLFEWLFGTIFTEHS